MKKHLKKFLWLSPFLLVALYWLGIYLSLKNPMEEINYAENGGWMRYVMFKPFTETIVSGKKTRIFRPTPILKELSVETKNCLC